MEGGKPKMICDQCYHRSNCEDMPDMNGRCSEYLKDGEIIFDEETKFNPSDTIEFNYDHLKIYNKLGSSKFCRTNSS